ncbi:DUF2252 domain-containing protein [Oerskovia sp. Sa1BUA8]|uniref:DUF2252 domain-containing protein n=1 Tax=Oerskovia douganii TaxID=2762210 RepID=A0A9D5U773_9CELL|nr:DUF2252 domain-containing protein [Oerskovia douganii]MBE7699783.1 DUF2252 domain-containing protein [Oerskovia douganii]
MPHPTDHPQPTPVAPLRGTPPPELRRQEGRAARTLLPRSTTATWEPPADRRDPVGILTAQNASRVPDLVPLRMGRMAATPFSFFRGAAAVMAADLGTGPRSGLTVQLCGDAHLANFGGFASPERSLVFDVNDFDETHHGPFEWDVQRLAASLEIAGRHRDLPPAARQQIVLAAARAYRETLRTFGDMGHLDVWHVQLRGTEVVEKWRDSVPRSVVDNLGKALRKARTKDRQKARRRLTRVDDDGELRFRSDPPLLVPVRELFDDDEQSRLLQVVVGALSDYGESLTGARRVLLERYRLVDLARRVVGVGSVGTRCWVALLVGRDNDDPLFLQVKEAEPSVLEAYTSPSPYPENGRRVVEGQHLLQATSDALLGWNTVQGADDRRHDYYFRQLWDWKVSADLDSMVPEAMAAYAQMCAWVLARGHARSGNALAIGSYLGKGDVADRSFAEFATRYADQNELDHRALLDAIAAGDVEAVTGV